MPAPRILIVDDNPVFCEMLEASLQRAGYHAFTVGSGQAALDYFEQAPVDLVLVDALMPGSNGYWLCSELRKRSDLPIIMLTALNNPEAIVYGLSQGIDDYVTKPFQLRELDVRIQALLQRREQQRCTEFGAEYHHASNVTLASASYWQGVVLDPATSELRAGAYSVMLTTTEAQVFMALMRSPDHLVESRKLIRQIWQHSPPDDTGLLDAVIQQLQEKLASIPDQPFTIETGKSETKEGAHYQLCSRRPPDAH